MPNVKALRKMLGKMLIYTVLPCGFSAGGPRVYPAENANVFFGVADTGRTLIL
jgi:hypothetical protein